MKSFLILFSLLIVGSMCKLFKDEPEYELEIKVLNLLHRLPQSVLSAAGNSFLLSSSGNEFDPKCYNRSEDFKKALGSVIECVNATDLSLPMCTILKTRLITCLTPAIDFIEDCMVEKSKGVPTLIIKAVVSGISHLCGITGEQIFEFFSDCIIQMWNIKDENINKELQDKFDKIKKDLSVRNICSNGPEIKNLIKESLRKSCPRQMTQTVYTEMMDAVWKPCTTIDEV